MRRAVCRPRLSRALALALALVLCTPNRLVAQAGLAHQGFRFKPTQTNVGGNFRHSFISTTSGFRTRAADRTADGSRGSDAIAATPPSFVQSTATALYSSAVPVSLPGATGTGDVILVGFDLAGAVDVIGVTDSQGNPFTQIGTELVSPTAVRSRVYAAWNIAGGTETVTITLSAAADVEAYLSEYTGVDPIHPIDGTVGVAGDAGSVSSGALTTHTTGALLYGFCVGDWSCDSGAGFTARSTFHHNLVEDLAAGAPGVYAATGTADAGWTMRLVALAPSVNDTLSPPPVITSTTSAGGVVGTQFTYQITATNTPTSFGATGLPAGLTVNTTTGQIGGTPTSAGSSTVALTATNAGGTGSSSLTITIAPPPPVITSATSAGGVVGTAFSYQITATNSPTNFGAAGLPDGLGVDPTTGQVTGTPLAPGSTVVTLSATNAAGNGTAMLTVTIAMPPPAVTSPGFANGIVGMPFTYQITATNSPASFGAIGLPAGLTVNTATGLISGTPTAAGTTTATISATNSGGTSPASLALNIAPTPSVQTSATAMLSSIVPISLPGTTGAGDLVLIGFDFDANVQVVSVTDSQGNRFFQQGAELVSPTGVRSRVYTASNIGGGAETVTVTLSATANVEAYLTEYTGLNPINPIDGAVGASGTAGTASSGSFTTSTAGEIIVGFCVGDWACDTGPGFNARSTFHHNLIEDATAGAPGAYAATAIADAGWTMQLVALVPASVTSSGGVVVNFNDVHQRIDGFGAADVFRPALTDAQADLFFSPSLGIGLSMLRVGISSTGGDLSSYSNATKAAARGARVWAAPWSAPGAWKDNGTTTGGGHLLASRYDDWATVLANFADNLQLNAGVTLSGLSVQNEPDFTASYDSMVYTPDEMVSFVKVLDPKLAALESRPMLMLPEVSNWSGAWDYTSAVLADSTAASYLDVIAAHQYLGVSTPQTAARPIWETEMSSFEPFDPSITNGLRVARWIRDAIVIGNASAWHYWWLKGSNGDNEGLIEGKQNPQLTKRLYTLGNFSKFVRPGFVVVGTSGLLPDGVTLTSFKDPASGAFVIVAINETGLDLPLTVTLNGAAAIFVTPWVTSSSLDLMAQPAVPVSSGSFTVTLPASSVTSFVGPGGM